MTGPRRDHTREPVGTGWEGPVLVLVSIGAVVAGAMWLGGQLASLLSGNGWASGHALAGIGAIGRPGEPSSAWRSEMPGPGLYWPVVAVVTITVCWLLGRAAVVRRRRERRRDDTALASRPGMATTQDVRRSMGEQALLSRAESLRPTLARSGRPVAATDVGWDWGRVVPGRDHLFTSVRDAVVLLGPSGAGKTAYVVIPRILDAPGALIVTSIRPDVLTPTFEARSQVGPVSVLAADGSVSGLPSVMSWSPIRGCEDGETAQVRAHVLAAGTSAGVETGGFWEGQTESVLTFLLHAAALSGASIDELWRWTLNPGAAEPAVAILESDPRAEPEWAIALRGILSGDDRTTANVWGGVRMAMRGLDVAAVRRRFAPAPGREFDPVRFLREKGTLYLLAKENDPASRLLAALIADVVRVAKMMADASPGGRLDPPLTLMLDEIANFAKLPDLPTWVSGFGGSGVVPLVVLQGLAQMRITWGEDAAAAIWQAATIKAILGGITDAGDLRDFSSLTGMRDEATWGTSRNNLVSQSVSSSVRQVPVLNEGEIRGLEEGTSFVLFKGNPPALVEMTAYFRRREAAQLAADQRKWEAVIADQAAARLTSVTWHSGMAE